MSSTPQLIAKFARQQPDTVAIVKGDVRFSYHTLATQLVQLTKALQELTITRGTLVGIECPDRHLHLLLILGCEIVGATSVSFSRNDLNPNNRLLPFCGIIFLSAPQDGLSAQRALIITSAWFQGVFGRPVHSDDFACLDMEPEPEQIVRINRTSGTTGRPKVMENSHRLQKIYIEKKISAVKSKTFIPLKFLCLYGLIIRNVHLKIRMTLHTGGTVIFTDIDNFYRDCERFDGIYTYLLLFDLQQLVSNVPDNFRRPSACYLQPGGGLLSPALRDKAMQAFASELDYQYNSNETALISQIDENGVGTLVSGVEAAVVDEFGKPKPYGEAGSIRLKTDAMVNGYLQDPELTAAWFVDGWFRSSDIGYMPEPGKLVVLGRAGDMLNIGGSKISPHSLAERARQIAGVRDIALAAVSNTNGIGEIAAAVEIKESSDRNFIRVQLQKILPSHLGPIHVMFTGALPRTENGKIRMRDVEERLQTVFGGDSTQRP